MTRVDPDMLDPYPGGPLLRSSLSGIAYAIDEELGAGAFGKVYVAHRFGPRNGPSRPLCVKILRDQRSWHGEAYFGDLLREDDRVIRLLDAFPYSVQAGGSLTQYFVLVTELAQQGDLLDYVAAKGAWPEPRAVREVTALLRVVERLHAIGVLHRDLTPMNILVDGRGRLKLADFGIARTSYSSPGVRADLRNPYFVTQGHARMRHKYWTTQDDIYQLGQLLAMLLAGYADRTMGRRSVQRLRCTDRIKSVILKATGPRPHRYAHAAAMAAALQGDARPTPTSLRGKRVAITGVLSIARTEAVIRLQQAGAQYQDKTHSNTDVVVVGRPSPNYPRRGRKGLKLKYATRRANAHRIATISEVEFMRLTRRRRRPRT